MSDHRLFSASLLSSHALRPGRTNGSFHSQLPACANLLQRFGVPTQADYNTRFRLMTQPQKKTRRQMLEEFVITHPDDAFARYGLAMDCANAGDTTAADEHFQTLLKAHPEYIAAYFQYGQLLARTARTDQARSTLMAGIAVARKAGDDHARSEMEAALAELG